MGRFEYTTVIRMTRGSYGHECEELDAFLNEYAKKGWWLNNQYFMDEQITGGVRAQVFIFERAAHEKQNS